MEVWSYRPPYPILILRQELERPWVSAKGPRRGHFTSAGITDVRSIFGHKGGVEERVTSVNSAVSICEVKCKTTMMHFCAN